MAESHRWQYREGVPFPDWLDIGRISYDAVGRPIVMVDVGDSWQYVTLKYGYWIVMDSGGHVAVEEDCP